MSATDNMSSGSTARRCTSLPTTASTALWRRRASRCSSSPPTRSTASSTDGSCTLEQPAETEIAFTPAGEPFPLIDRFPPLRLYLNQIHEGLVFVPCLDIQLNTVGPGGRTTEERLIAVHDGRVHTVPADDDVLLARLSDELHLNLTRVDVEHILRETESHTARARKAAIRDADNDDTRLVLAVGEEAIRRSLPRRALEALESGGRRLTGRELAQAARAVHGLSVLGKLRQGLTDNGLEPPDQWAGGSRARLFVTDLGFSADLAGLPGSTRPALAVVEGLVKLPNLHDYQKRVLARIRDLLRGEGHPRGLVSLPTGAGKTRVAVEAIIRHLADTETAGGPVLWVAQTDELCEQAVQTWRFVWRAVGPRSRLHISRLWSTNESNRSRTGTFRGRHRDKLDSVCASGVRVAEEADIVVIDEAHASISPAYTGLLGWVGLARRVPAAARPYRDAVPGPGMRRRRTVLSRYGENRLDGDSFEGDAYAQLQDGGVLAKVDHGLIDGAEIDLTDSELHEMETFRRFPHRWRIVWAPWIATTHRSSIFDLPGDWTVLVFARPSRTPRSWRRFCLLRGYLPGGVRQYGSADRRHYVERFRPARIRVLTNYGVLTQGFDAPGTRPLRGSADVQPERLPADDRARSAGAR